MMVKDAILSSIRRIGATLLRYLYLHKRSLPRILELFFWPIMELMVWGFFAQYIHTVAEDKLTQIVSFLLTAIIFWDILYRSQQAISISIMEDVWTQNIVNVLISPLKIWEWQTATFLYGAIKSLLITLILSIVALGLYEFNLILGTGFYLIPLIFNLFLFGWALGVGTSGLLIRWGYSAEALIWGIPFLIQPLSAIYYPLSALPEPIQIVSKMLPSTYVFEGMRYVIEHGSLPIHYFGCSLGLNIIFFVLGSLFFQWMFRLARNEGRLGHLGMD